jgi:hypothetical protein
MVAALEPDGGQAAMLSRQVCELPRLVEVDPGDFSVNMCAGGEHPIATSHADRATPPPRPRPGWSP